MSVALTTAFLNRFGHAPTDQQAAAFNRIADYLTIADKHSLFVLKGAAGTGKTTMLRAISGTLRSMGWHIVLLAPTGRAAKVAAERTGLPAQTIHRAIYQQTNDDGIRSARIRAHKLKTQTLLIIDEASMLNDTPGDGFRGRDGLLRDLLRFIWQPDAAIRVLLVGDPAQLPPVGTKRSPALSVHYLQSTLNLKVAQANLTAVKRQALESGVLALATFIRDQLKQSPIETFPQLPDAPDVELLFDGEALLERFLDAFDAEDPESVIVLCGSNRIAGEFNQAVRRELHYDAGPLAVGDRVMVVRNHYFRSGSTTKFVANGELGRITRILSYDPVPLFDEQWQQVEIEFTDETGMAFTLTRWVPLDLLYAKSPQLPREIEQQVDALIDSRDSQPLADENPAEGDWLDSYLQLKMGYAITAHKAQGGQWRQVILLFEPYLFEPRQDEDTPADTPHDFTEALRWLYTAVTRAREGLVLYRPPKNTNFE